MVTKIRDSPIQMQFSCLFAIPRGGLVPARIVSELLDIKRIVTNINDVKQTDAVLIIDDISDSGKTLVKIINKFQESADLKQVFVKKYAKDILRIGEMSAKVLQKGNKIIFCFDIRFLPLPLYLIFFYAPGKPAHQGTRAYPEVIRKIIFRRVRII